MGNFVDHVKIICKAGNGGNGSMSFHREKFVLNGGPDGGDGGNGGNVCFYADLNMHTLLDFRFKSKYTAENGVDGAAGNCTGKRGEDLIIKVPVGTVIREAESGAVVADMDTAGVRRCRFCPLQGRTRRLGQSPLCDPNPASAELRQARH